MSLTEPCPRCGEQRAWLLRPVHEMGGIMSVEQRGDALVGWYEAAVCVGCGWSQFWARDYEPLVAAQPMSPCVVCAGQRGFVVDEAPDVTEPDHSIRMRVHLAPGKFKLSLMFSHGGWVGILAVRICADCSAANWFCHAEAVFPEDLEPPIDSPRACRRCQGAQSLSSVDDAAPDQGRYQSQWSGERAIAAVEAKSIFVHYAKRLGKFELDVCRSCFTVEWYGTRLEELTEDPKLGLFHLQRGPSDADSGPYR